MAYTFDQEYISRIIKHYVDDGLTFEEILFVIKCRFGENARPIPPNITSLAKKEIKSQNMQCIKGRWFRD